MSPTPPRCAWVPDGDDLYIAYHDEEWGRPIHDDHRLFEMISLEGAQAGLSWRTILGRRDHYRDAFAGFDPVAVARFGDTDVDRLVADARIIRHRGKIESVVANARAVLEVQDRIGSLDDYVWAFVDGTPVVNAWTNVAEIPAQTPASAAMSKDMKRRGFRFVGPTTMYAFMQAAGLVDDHTSECFRTAER